MKTIKDNQLRSIEKVSLLRARSFFRIFLVNQIINTIINNINDGLNMQVYNKQIDIWPNPIIVLMLAWD